jgi:hypothetical protein
MEEIFKDVSYDFREAPTNQAILDAYVDLVELYLRVLRETTNWLCEDNPRGAPLGRLLAAAAANSELLTIITFNHDLVIENEIYRRAHLRRRWCLDMGYGGVSEHLNVLTPMSGGIPVFGLHRMGHCDHTQPSTF